MRRAVIALVAVAAMTAGALLAASPAQAASLTQITNFGNNPTNLGFYLYVPDNIPTGTKPAVLVASHYCTGSGPAFFSGTQFASLADQYKFIVIYPSATRSGSCFDVSTAGALTHNGSSDPAGIISMVNWVVANRNGDPNRVYATGASSGGMMTNVLLGDYPDVFKAGAAFMGVPFFCFRTDSSSMWNNACADGQTTMTAQQWGDLVRNADPGYSGARPRMQLWHGTADTTLNYHNFGEEIKQWTNVLGVSQTPVSTDTPQSGWTRTRYGNTSATAPVEAISIAGVGHSLPLSGQAAMAIHFFGLDSTATPPTSPTPTGGGGTCTANLIAGTVFGDRYNTTVNVTGTSTWIVTITLTAPQKMSSTWNANFVWSGAGFIATATPNGSGNSFGFTTMFNGNTTARPSATCRVG